MWCSCPGPRGCANSWMLGLVFASSQNSTQAASRQRLMSSNETMIIVCASRDMSRIFSGSPLSSRLREWTMWPRSRTGWPSSST